MSDSPTTPGRRRFGAAAFIAALAVAMAAFGGLVLPRMASDGSMPAIMRASPDDPVVVRREPRRSCKSDHVQRAAERPVFISPADR
jgi:hypothetical protein